MLSIHLETPEIVVYIGYNVNKKLLISQCFRKDTATNTHISLYMAYAIRDVCCDLCVWFVFRRCRAVWNWWPLTHWLWENVATVKNCNIWSRFMDRYLERFLWSRFYVNATRPHWWYVNIGPGNDLVPAGNKSAPELLLTQVPAVIWHH